MEQSHFRKYIKWYKAENKESKIQTSSLDKIMYKKKQWKSNSLPISKLPLINPTRDVGMLNCLSICVSMEFI